jgi:ergothioneine biosynthesis protein EgtB
MTRKELCQAYLSVRKITENLCTPLQIEDYVIQPMDDVSPPKWHLGHTTWFFERFLLGSFSSGYRPVNDLYEYLFNSYYESVGDRWLRPRRGVLSRPTVKEVHDYRSTINGRMHELMDSVSEKDWPHFCFLTTLGIHHEQQHQELLVTDIKNILAINPLRPVYRERRSEAPGSHVLPARFIEFPGGVSELGFTGDGFSFDNERPLHKTLLQSFLLQNRLVTNGEYLEFINDGGYGDFQHWLSDGWYAVQREGWKAPLYWEKKDGNWFVMTLSGFRKLDPAEPVCHVSYFEADAFAHWAGKRLPTEAEWECAARTIGSVAPSANFVESERYHPAPLQTRDTSGLLQMLGDVWEWTVSAYLPYPGFQPEPGAVGEYNGKFMSNQMVLRGGSCATPENHIRITYRNFFQCDKRWQFSGIRLAANT